jgi:transcription elongation factor Elf1
MIKVLKHGETIKEVTCKHCGALLSYDLSDIADKTSYSDGLFYLEDYITCPDCNRVIVLSSTK